MGSVHLKSPAVVSDMILSLILHLRSCFCAKARYESSSPAMMLLV